MRKEMIIAVPVLVVALVVFLRPGAKPAEKVAPPPMHVQVGEDEQIRSEDQKPQRILPASVGQSGLKQARETSPKPPQQEAAIRPELPVFTSPAAKGQALQGLMFQQAQEEIRFFRESLNLTDAEVEQLRDLRKISTNAMSDFTSMRGDVARVQEIRADTQARIRQMLGDSKYLKFVEFEKRQSDELYTQLAGRVQGFPGRR